MNKKIKKILSTISPELTTRLMYRYNFHKRLDLNNPIDINDKLQYLKLRTYYNNATITQCVDKYRVREYLQEKGYGDILPQFIGGPYYDAEELRNVWNQLPPKFVIKCNHGCGYNILVSNKRNIELDEVIEKLSYWLKEDYWKIYCEPQYRYVKKAFIIEEYLGDNIETYKFYCFNGKPEVMYLSSNGENGEKDYYLDYYDMDMNWVDLTLFPHAHAKVKAKKPDNYEQMVKLSEKLSSPFPFVRIDLYNVDGHIYFSEFTFIPTGGNMKLIPEHYISDWGKLLNI